MRQLIELAANRPEIPLFIGVLLYIWIGVASYMIKKPDLAGMWLCYAAANGFMFWHYVR